MKGVGCSKMGWVHYESFCEDTMPFLGIYAQNSTVVAVRF